MRIISGKYRGRQLQTLKGGKLRPTSDQLRETLFDVLGPGIVGARFLDAYAGSGAVGLEALSRGASEVVFIEHHRAAATLIRQNLDALEITSGYRLVTRDVLMRSSGSATKARASTSSFSIRLTRRFASITTRCANSRAASCSVRSRWLSRSTRVIPSSRNATARWLACGCCARATRNSPPIGSRQSHPQRKISPSEGTSLSCESTSPLAGSTTSLDSRAAGRQPNRSGIGEGDWSDQARAGSCQRRRCRLPDQPRTTWRRDHPRRMFPGRPADPSSRGSNSTAQS